MKKIILIIIVAFLGCNNDREKMEGLIKKRDNIKKSLDSCKTLQSLPYDQKLQCHIDVIIIRDKNFPLPSEFVENEKNRTRDSIRYVMNWENYYMPYISFYDSAYNETLKQIKDLELLRVK